MTFSVELLRPDDLLHLYIDGENLRIDTHEDHAPVVVLDDARQPGFLIVRFAPQTVIEEAFHQQTPATPETSLLSEEKDSPLNTQQSSSAPDIPPHTRARIGQPSRLVFRVPPGSSFALPFSISGLLDWAELDLSVTPLAALPPTPSLEQRLAAPAIAAPSAHDSAIELPYRLVLSPNADVVWLHDQEATAHAGFIALWHTRLALRNAARNVTEISRTLPAPLRAIWSEDFGTSGVPPFGAPDSDWQPAPTLTAMTPSDRYEIVVLTCGFSGYVKDKRDFRWYEPRPILASRLMLSALGGWLTSRGDWDPPCPYLRVPIIGVGMGGWKEHLSALSQRASPLFPVARFAGADDARAASTTQGESQPIAPDTRALTTNATSMASGHAFGTAGDALARFLDPRQWADPRGITGSLLNVMEWSHIATLGRDHYVRIVYEGFLYPLGHRASLVKVTERRIVDSPSRGRLAHMVQRHYIVVREPLRNYRDPEVFEQLEHEGRNLPFNSIRLTTLVTPDIADPNTSMGRLANSTAFWVRLDSGGSPTDDFKFHGIGEDVGHGQIDFGASMVFVPNSEVNQAGITTIRQAYDSAGTERRCSIPGQRLNFVGGGSDNTALVVNELYFSTQAAPFDKTFGGFLPCLLFAKVRLPAVELLTGAGNPLNIAFHRDYLLGTAGNVNGLFAWVVSELEPGHVGQAVSNAPFQARDAGGLATPNLAITSLTSELGPLAGDPLKALSNGFDAKDFFGAMSDAQLFGTFPLMDLIASVTASEGAPKMRITTETAPQKAIVGMLDWKPKLHDVTIPGTGSPIAKFVAAPVGKPPASFEIKVTVVKNLDTPATLPATDIRSELRHFSVELLKVVSVHFDSFIYTSRPGEKPDVSVALDRSEPVEFLEDLQFVNALKDTLPPDLFGDGPSLDISATGIKAGFSIGLPPVALGVFALRDMSFGAFLELPFADGRPLLDLAFCRREKPFNLTVAFLGGGGFFHLQTDTDGVKMLEAALEFGASTSVNLGVASGGVYIMAGIYFSLQRKSATAPDLSATLGGYLRMGGELSILSLISVSLEFYLAFIYVEDKHAAYGIATLTVKVEVLCFSKSVEITVEKSFGSTAGDPLFVDTFDAPKVWLEYAEAFA